MSNDKCKEMSDKFNELYEKFIKDDDVKDFAAELGLQADSDPNIFKVLGAANYEIRHSNFLAWLLDPKGNHGLGDAVLSPFLRDAGLTEAEVKKITRGNVTVHREWPGGGGLRIDILIESEAYVICVEVKWYAGEGPDQLRQYKDAVDGKFPDLKRVYVYLTQNGEESSMPGVYKPMSFTKDIAQILENLEKLKNINEKVKCFIKQYKDILKGGAMTHNGDPNSIKKARKLYDEYKELFDVVCCVKKMDEKFEMCKDIIQKYLKERDYCIGSETKAQNEPVAYVKWYPKQIGQYIYRDTTNNWKPKRETFLFYTEIYKDKLIMYLCLNNFKADNHYERGKLHGILNELETRKGNMVSRDYRPFRQDESYEFDNENRNHWIAYRYRPHKFDLCQSKEGSRKQIEAIFAAYKSDIDDVIALLDEHGDDLRNMKAEAEADRDK